MKEGGSLLYRFSAERLVELREARGLSLEMLAALAGVRYASAYRYENGTRTPGVLPLFSLASVLGVDPHELIVDDEAPSDPR